MFLSSCHSQYNYYNQLLWLGFYLVGVPMQLHTSLRHAICNGAYERRGLWYPHSRITSTSTPHSDTITDRQEKLLLLADIKKHESKRIYYLFAATIKSGKTRIHKRRIFKWWTPLRWIVVHLQRTAPRPKWVSHFQEAVNLILFILTPTRSCKSTEKIIKYSGWWQGKS